MRMATAVDEEVAEQTLAELEQKLADGHMLTSEEVRKLQESAHASIMSKLEAGHMLTAEELLQVKTFAVADAAKDAAGLRGSLGGRCSPKKSLHISSTQQT